MVAGHEERCSGHQSFISFKMNLVAAGVLSPLFSVCHLLRQSNYQERLWAAMCAVLDKIIDEPEATECPRECREYLKEFLRRTLMRNK